MTPPAPVVAPPLLVGNRMSSQLMIGGFNPQLMIGGLDLSIIAWWVGPINHCLVGWTYQSLLGGLLILCTILLNILLYSCQEHTAQVVLRLVASGCYSR